MARKALIFGIAGQDGSYLAELLVAKGYDVAGVVREDGPVQNLAGVRDRIVIETFDDDPAFIRSLLARHQPDELYNLAAQSHVGASWDRLADTVEAGTMLPARIIDAVHKLGLPVRCFQASTAALFGSLGGGPQDEDTPMLPSDPYGISKYAAHRLSVVYRERYGYHFSTGILYNHESPRRPRNFVTRKITNAVARIKLGRENTLVLGNLGSVRDWGYAPDYVEAAWMMLQPDTPGDYVIATGKGRTVREFVETAFGLAGLDWEKYVEVDASLMRPNEGALVGDPSRICERLGWKPRTSFEDMVGKMLDADMELESRGL
ncbi:MAG TPA: GDP-mannose 4,6-dehydratase [Nitrospirota bacterium]